MVIRVLAILLFCLFVILSCNEVKFKVGECIQAPDGFQVYKVQKIENSKMFATKVDKKDSNLETLDTSKMWVPTNCILR